LTFRGNRCHVSFLERRILPTSPLPGRVDFKLSSA